MNYKFFKILSILTAILLVLSCTGTILGYKTYKKNNYVPEPNPDNNQTIVDRNIKYKYFLEGVEVNEIPTNPKSGDTNESNETENEQLYRFDEYKCTNGVTGTFDTTEWKFTPSKDLDSTCELYFNKTKYEVTLTVIKGTPDESNNYFVERFKDGEFKINPDVGYQYLESQCSNDKAVTYDTSKNILKISAVSSDIACKVSFTQKKLTFELEVKNGKCENYCTGGKIKTSGYYGDNLLFVIYPQDRYEFKTGNIKCNNGQVAKYENNNFSIDSLTANAKCTLTFTKANMKKYKISIINSQDESVKDKFTISQGSDEITVEEGSTGVIKIQANEGVTEKPSLIECTQVPDITNAGSETTFTWMGVSKNITCKLAVAEN